MNDQKINELTILIILARCEVEVTTEELFELITNKGTSTNDPIGFIKMINNLREIGDIKANYKYDSLIHWKITDPGRRRITGEETL